MVEGRTARYTFWDPREGPVREVKGKEKVRDIKNKSLLKTLKPLRPNENPKLEGEINFSSFSTLQNSLTLALFCDYVSQVSEYRKDK